MTRMKTLLGCGTVLLAGIAFGSATDKAEAQCYSGGYYSYYSPPAVVYQPPVYYQPAPVYVAPRHYRSYGRHYDYGHHGYHGHHGRSRGFAFGFGYYR